MNKEIRKFGIIFILTLFPFYAYATLPPEVLEFIKIKAAHIQHGQIKDPFKSVLTETKQHLTSFPINLELRKTIRENIDYLLDSSIVDKENYGYLDLKLQNEISEAFKSGISNHTLMHWLGPSSECSDPNDLLKGEFSRIYPILHNIALSKFDRSSPSVPKIRKLEEINPNFEPFLYSIQLNRRSKPIYLLGSEHSIPLDLFPEVVNLVQEHSDILVREIEFKDEPQNPLGELAWVSGEEMAHLGFYKPSGFKWTSKLHPGEEEILKKALEPIIKNLWQANDLDQIHPSIVEFALNRKLLTLVSGSGIDAEVAENFTAANKPIIGLETGQERAIAYNLLARLSKQAENFSNSDIHRMREALNLLYLSGGKHVDNHYRSESEFKTYVSGDLKKFQKLAESPAIIARNSKWIPRMNQIIAENTNRSILFMVGAAHLPGQNGILKFFKDQRAPITQVSKSGKLLPEP